jgi:hypothetical protein
MTTTATKTARAQSKGRIVLLASAAIVVCALAAFWLSTRGPASAAPPAAIPAAKPSRLTLEDIPFNGQRAYEYLQELCAIGTRVSASQGMQAQQKLLAEHFEKLGAKVVLQRFRVRHPVDGSPVSMANLIVQWQPEATERIMLCTHYDTRPFPDRDPRNPQGTFLGANDGASGTALLMELGNSMPKIKGKLGVDFVFFDGEEFVFEEGHPYFIGSEYFALAYTRKPSDVRYRYAVLLDMIGDADLQIVPDRHSMSWADSRPLVESIWKTAERLGVSEFDVKGRCDVLDDHLKLHNIGKIPSCDLIDFRYPFWHTEGDVPERCSALSLAKVGWVVQTWLEEAVKQ